MRTPLEILRLDEQNLVERLRRTRQRIRQLALESHVPPVIPVPVIQYHQCQPHTEASVRIHHRT